VRAENPGGSWLLVTTSLVEARVVENSSCSGGTMVIGSAMKSVMERATGGYSSWDVVVEGGACWV
jgi:hypothetical protein